MKYLKQFGIILAVSFAGELCRYLIPLPIPASIYGLIILFIGLTTKLIPLESVKDTGKFLIEIMPVMFIPSAVGLMNIWGVLKPICIPVIIITLLSTFIVMVLTGRVTQFVIRKDGAKKAKAREDEAHD